MHDIWNNLNFKFNFDEITQNPYWEFEISDENSEIIFSWIETNIQNDFSILFFDYYYILILSKESDATLYKLTWGNYS